MASAARASAQAPDNLRLHAPPAQPAFIPLGSAQTPWPAAPSAIDPTVPTISDLQAVEATWAPAPVFTNLSLRLHPG